MKSKLFLLMYLCLAAFTTNLNAQDTAQANSTSDTVKSRTYSFAGIEIKGAYIDFVNALKKKGYTYLTTDTVENFIALSGKISGLNVTLGVFWTPISKEVYRIALVYQEHENWNSLLSEFKNLSNIINTKYGDGYCYEKWTAPYDDNHDGYELLALKTGHLEKYCYWDGIELRMNKRGNNYLTYYNPQIQAVYRKEQQQIDEETY